MFLDYYFYTILFLLGSVFGSFASVLLFRLRSGKKGIIFGRSECPHCKKKLSFVDLIPLLGFIWNKGKCSNCHKKISIIYPILELTTAALFTITGVFLIDNTAIFSGDIYTIFQLLFFLHIVYITILYIFYDILFMEIHEGIMLVGITSALIGASINSFGNTIFVHTLPAQYDSSLAIGSLLIAIFFLQVFYIIMLKGLKEIYDILLLLLLVGIAYFVQTFLFYELKDSALLSASIGALGIFIFFYLQIFISRGRAMGGGDLRIGIMIGLLLGINYSYLGIIAAYIVGSVVGIVIIIKNIRKKGMNEVPFGPFLGTGFLIVFFFHTELQHLLEQNLLML